MTVDEWRTRRKRELVLALVSLAALGVAILLMGCFPRERSATVKRIGCHKHTTGVFTAKETEHCCALLDNGVRLMIVPGLYGAGDTVVYDPSVGTGCW